MIITKNLRYFENIDTPNKAYFVGFIAADGALVKNKNSNSIALTITIHSKDVQILELLKSELQNESSIKIINHKSKALSSYKLDVDHRRFSIARKELIQDLINLGIGHNKSLNMGSIIKNIPKEFRKAFIIGYFDGDGCFVDSLVLKKRKRYNSQGIYIKTDESYGYNSQISIKGTYEFLKGIVDELSITKYALKQISGQKIHTLTIIANQEIIKFYNCYNNCDFYLQRKKDKFARKILQVQTISSS